ncbi:MAG: DUF5103 domain-containing protein [Cyclobacteriaceae bacterium]
MKNLFILTTIILFTQCEPVPTRTISQTKKMIFDDHNYEEIIGNVQLVPSEDSQPLYLESPVVLSGTGQTLFLSFDLLTDQFEYLAAKIYHCNKDWSKSILRDMEFLNEINTFRITEYDFSVNTKQPYINYRLDIPNPKISGNFIVAIFRRGNPDDILFTRKFMIAEPKTTIEQQVRRSTTVSVRDFNQQIDFSVNYGNIQVNSPTEDVSVIILQNHRWLDALDNLKPSLIRPNENYMEFRLLNLENNFPGWNEFRFFDLRTLNVTGRNVGKIYSEQGEINVQLGLDQSRNGAVYTQNLRDINGNYILQNNDAGGIPLNSDYAKVRFYLKSGKINGKVYVTGRFNNWTLSDNNRLKYDDASGVYSTSLLLKQGYYDYLYWVDGPNLDQYRIEGSHFQTENDYEILVYYRKPGNVYDELIGYKKFNSIPN